MNINKVKDFATKNCDTISWENPQCRVAADDPAELSRIKSSFTGGHIYFSTYRSVWLTELPGVLMKRQNLIGA
jgi:hypothetical protein